MLKGTIVENSLRDKSILASLQIEKTRQDGDWVLHDVLIGEAEAIRFGQYLVDGPWYIHFWEPGTDNVLIVFKDKNFMIEHSDKTTWTEAIAYGKFIGIPEEQLDFVVQN